MGPLQDSFGQSAERGRTGELTEKSSGPLSPLPAARLSSETTIDITHSVHTAALALFRLEARQRTIVYVLRAHKMLGAPEVLDHISSINTVYFNISSL